MLKEFKEFAVKGNMVDMAVGIIIGAAFGTVVKSVVDDLLTPLISAVAGTPDFSNLFVILRAPETAVAEPSVAAIREAGGVVLGYGLFINALIAFLIVALVLFVVVKGMNQMKRKEEAAPPEPEPEPVPTNEEVLLAEIRDLLQAQAAG
jgi:large conductance mechanosensitive channel